MLGADWDMKKIQPFFDKSLQKSKKVVSLLCHQIDDNGGPPVRVNS
jgi:hypothetical protein